MKYWNSLPKSIVESPPVPNFKNWTGEALENFVGNRSALAVR